MVVVVAANAPPVVSITAPASGASYFAPADVNLAATASDADGTLASVSFYQGTTLIGTSSASPYTVQWSGVAAGAYTLTARAVDNAGASTTSLPVAITVSAPALAIDTPVAGAMIAADHVHVQGSFNASASAGIVVNGVVAAMDGNRFYAANVPSRRVPIRSRRR